jgi:hypothetical protein
MPSPVAEPLTYGRHADRAARLAAAAAVQPLPASLPPDRAAIEASAITSLVAVAARHAHFLTRRLDDDQPAARFARYLTVATTAARRALPDVQPVVSNPWRRAADALSAAHDLLAAQIGPAGEHRGVRLAAH